MLSPRLVQHMREKLLIGEQVSNCPSKGQRFDDLLLMKDLDATLRGIQVQDDVMTDQVSRDIVAFEVEADLAMSIHGCRSRCSPSS